MKQEDIDLICNVEGDAPMATIFKSYWMPALLSSDLEIDGAPRRIRLLGKRLVAFRDSEGVVGVLDEFCPHRGASLALARNENCALQCLYHGWRTNRDGQIVETPAEPGGRNTIGTNVRQPSYRVHEVGQIVWVYLGEGEPPAPPSFDFTSLPHENVLVYRSILQTNWLRGLDGGFDTAHVMYLHADGLRSNWAADDEAGESTMWEVEGSGNDVAPVIEVEKTAYGLRYAGIRRGAKPGTSFMRGYHFVLPGYAYIPATDTMASIMSFVPMDNNTTLHWGILYRIDGQPMTEEDRNTALEAVGKRPGIDQDDEGWSFFNASNMWGQDREAMRRRESFSGIPGFWNEDYAVQESMPPNVHAQENLAKSDLAIIRVRRILRDLAAGVADGTATPPSFPEDFDVSRLRAVEAVVPEETDWRIVAPWLDDEN